MHRAYRNLKCDPTDAALERIIQSSEKLAAMNDYLQHEVRGLREAISLEKKKRKYGKWLNLLGEEDVGPQLFSPARIAQARLIASEKEEAERKEGMERAAMDGEDVSTREQMSTVGTPGPEADGTTPMQTQGETHPRTRPSIEYILEHTDRRI